jgi:FHS family L-fucose permease-like MFS transporter
MGVYKRKITVEDSAITSAVHLTLRQSLLPNALGTLCPDEHLESG